MSIGLRAISIEDEAFLFTVYASTRADELALVDWSAEQKAAFLRMQFEAQARFYRESFRAAKFQVILLDDKPVGRFYIQRGKTGIHVIDIAILPGYRGQGVGSHLLNQILEEAGSENLPVTIHVERMNPARHLYERLGFYILEEQGIHYLMEWRLLVREAGGHAG